ncbi:MAG: hypothetical protein U1E04_07905 [Hylemonella sp.]|jgi:hypothetical protein|nr:hypothetical protein [Hylemonella sp.]
MYSRRWRHAALRWHLEGLQHARNSLVVRPLKHAVRPDCPVLGEPSVTIGAYLNALSVLGLDFGIIAPAATEREKAYRKGWIPERIRLDEYPQLKQLAWQVHADTLTPAEALSIYTRNKRHIDERAMDERERELVKALHRARYGVA